MSHNIETMFSVREKPWHYEMTKDVTKLIQEAPTSAEALRIAGLDWNVEQTPVFTDDGNLIPNYKANIRSSDKAVLGIVSDRYKIVQNTEAFEFTDSVVGETEDGIVKYETAGSLNGGKRVWMLAKMPTKNIVGDDVEPYMCFTNSHDGTGSIRVCMTPIRVVCANTLSIALNNAKRQWSTKHIGNLEEKLEEAKLCLQLARNYMNNLDEEADRLANAKLYQEQVEEILEELFPVDENMTDRKMANVKSFKDDFMVAYFMPDLTKFKDTAWGAVNAMADVITHATPKRNTTTYEQNRWGKIIDGHPTMDRFVELVNKKIATVR